ncbi:hypothetical protein AKJ41_05990 [candidate division MSBL1 archaeon SCGC-AAA259O05]|uniref:Uncharacterized protein n=1 Tax=candidate division MSBL1 archaeon SCGC-AAA259O05 TaxID=1698271 RepID=A0A133UY16_9EURY|nr:hypothetical protein AKJ41_05990 [candidate division MSBL1 archaeon SCGC-AAA259O05]
MLETNLERGHRTRTKDNELENMKRREKTWNKYRTLPIFKFLFSFNFFGLCLFRLKNDIQSES